MPVGGLVAPDAEQVVVELEGDAERPPEASVRRDDELVVGREHRSRLRRARDERRGLAADHVEVPVDRPPFVVLGRPDVHELALAEREACLVVEPHEREDLGVGEALLGQPVERHPRQREEGVAGVDRLRHARDRPERGTMPALGAAVLDVVVDEAEVVAHLDGGGPRERAQVLAGDRLVREQADERPEALAPGPVPVEAHVVADHRVELGRALVLGSLDDPQDRGLGIGDEAVEVDAGQHANMIPVDSRFRKGAGARLTGRERAPGTCLGRQPMEDARRVPGARRVGNCLKCQAR